HRQHPHPFPPRRPSDLRQLEAGYPPRNPMRIAMLAPLARLACSAPLQLPCTAQRDEALGGMAQATSPADARRQIDLALRDTAQADRKSTRLNSSHVKIS